MTPMSSANVAIERLTPRPRPMSVEMSAPLAQLVPSRPCRTPPNQSQYCTRNGLSSPHWASTRWIASGVASSPSWIRAGLSPLIERSENVTNVATRKTGTKIAADRARAARTRPAACRSRVAATPRRGAAGAGSAVVGTGLPPLCGGRGSVVGDGDAGPVDVGRVLGQARDRLALGDEVRRGVGEDQCPALQPGPGRRLQDLRVVGRVQRGLADLRDGRLEAGRLVGRAEVERAVGAEVGGEGLRRRVAAGGAVQREGQVLGEEGVDQFLSILMVTVMPTLASWDWTISACGSSAGMTRLSLMSPGLWPASARSCRAFTGS